MMVLLPAQRVQGKKGTFLEFQLAGRSGGKSSESRHLRPIWNYGETLSLKIDDKNQGLAFKKGVCYL